MPTVSIEYTDYWDEWAVRFLTEKQEALRDEELPGGRHAYALPHCYGVVHAYKYIDDSIDYRVLFKSDDLVQAYIDGYKLITDYIKSGIKPWEVMEEERY